MTAFTAFTVRLEYFLLHRLFGSSTCLCKIQIFIPHHKKGEFVLIYEENMLLKQLKWTFVADLLKKTILKGLPKQLKNTLKVEPN